MNDKTPTGDTPARDIIAFSRLNEGNKVRLAEKLLKARNGHDITVAYLGGSITQGDSAGPELCYARRTFAWFGQEYPDTSVSYVNAGIGATGSYIGVHRAARDILCHDPDIVFVEFSVNDIDEGEGADRNVNSYDSLLRKIWHHQSRPAIITIAMTKEDGGSFQDRHLAVVKHYDLPMVSYREAVLAAMGAGEICWADVSDDDIHPNVGGHGFLAGLITDYLERADAVASDCSHMGGESDFSVPFTDDIYMEAAWFGPGDAAGADPDAGCCQRPTFARLLSCEGYAAADDVLGNIRGFWRVGSRMGFAVKCRNLGILYGKLVADGGDFDVYLDGRPVAGVSTDFSGGWGDHVAFAEVFNSDIAMKHIVEIVAKPAAGQKVLITALALS